MDEARSLGHPERAPWQLHNCKGCCAHTWGMQGKVWPPESIVGSQWGIQRFAMGPLSVVLSSLPPGDPRLLYSLTLEGEWPGAGLAPWASYGCLEGSPGSSGDL